MHALHFCDQPGSSDGSFPGFGFHWAGLGPGEALAGKWLNHRVSVVETAASRSLVPHSA
jgi:hypothetical protein